MATTRWLADPVHSEVQFKVKHLMITTVTGYFRNYQVEVETEDIDFTRFRKLLFTADTGSLDTNNGQRDNHLRSPDFFAAAQYPELRFEGKKLQRSGDGYVLEGVLTIRDTSKPISLVVDHGGIVTDAYGQTKAGFTIQGKIKRKDFGLMWDAMTEAGQVVVSNEVKIHVELQLVKQQPAEPVREGSIASKAEA